MCTNARAMAHLAIMCDTKCDQKTSWIRQRKQNYTKEKNNGNIADRWRILSLFSFRECRARKKLRYQVNRTFPIITTLERTNHICETTWLWNDKLFQYVDDIIAAREQANDKLRDELVRYDWIIYIYIYIVFLTLLFPNLQSKFSNQ